MGDRGQMENGIVFDRGVEAGVIAEGSLGPRLTRLHIAFEYNIHVRRHIDVYGLAANKLD